MTIDAFTLVKAKLIQMTESEWTEEEVNAYLVRLKKTPEQWLEWDATLSASISDVGAKEPPDPEKDPEGYQHFLDSQYPGGLGLPAKKG